MIAVGAVNCTLELLNNKLVSFVDNGLVFPQLEVYASLILSPALASKLLLYFIRIVLDVKLPESKTPVEPTAPIGIDHA